MKECFKCGKPSTREARVNESGNLDINLPLRPVCDDCGPKWFAVGRMTSKGIVPLTEEDEKSLEGLPVSISNPGDEPIRLTDDEPESRFDAASFPKKITLGPGTYEIRVSSDAEIEINFDGKWAMESRRS